MSSPTRALSAVATALVAVVLLSHAFIDLELAAAVPLPGGRTWQANAPVADLAALLLLPLGLLAGLRSPRLPAPGAVGWGLLLLAGVLGLGHALDPAGALHHLVRKPLFVYLAHGIGLSWAIARLVPPRRLGAVVGGALALTALVSLASSVGRIAAGDALWFHRLEGLTPNHKTLAVCLSGWLPLLATAPGLRRLPRLVVGGLVLLAIVLSASKTAWITTVVSAALLLPRSRPLAFRPRLMAPVVVLAVALAYYAPVIVGSRAMLDAARSRHSLDVRAWEMFRAHPLVGSGSGMSTQVEMVTFPHYRINGVDAHGAVQKTAGENGLLGLVGLGLFAWAAGRDLRRRWKAEALASPTTPPTRLATWGCLGSFIALHSNLLFSTEVHSPTHWVPLATAWGLSLALSPGPRAEAASPPPPEAPCAS